jgi:chemotaxis response regulator CheB
MVPGDSSVLILTRATGGIHTLRRREYAMEKPIRVLVANRPRLMRDTILTTFADQPDIEIVGEVEDESEILESVKRTQPDFVVIALDHPGKRPPICDVLLYDHPEIRLIAVAPANNYVVYYWASLDIHASSIEASEEGVLGVLRNKLSASKSN